MFFELINCRAIYQRDHAFGAHTRWNEFLRTTLQSIYFGIPLHMDLFQNPIYMYVDFFLLDRQSYFCK